MALGILYKWINASWGYRLNLLVARMGGDAAPDGARGRTMADATVPHTAANARIRTRQAAGGDTEENTDR